MKVGRSVAVMVMSLVLVASAAQAGFYAGFQVGPNFPRNAGAWVTAFNQTFNAGPLRLGPI
jgi:hypothetical protein